MKKDLIYIVILVWIPLYTWGATLEYCQREEVPAIETERLSNRERCEVLGGRFMIERMQYDENEFVDLERCTVEEINYYGEAIKTIGR